MPSHAADLARRLARNAEAVCRHYLSNGHREGRYWLVGDVANTPGRSLFVRLSGPDRGKGAAGKWTDAATGEHGDLLDLIALSRGLDRLRDVARRGTRVPQPCRARARAPTAGPPSGAARFARSRPAVCSPCRKPIAGTLAETYLRGRGIAALPRVDRAALPSALLLPPRRGQSDRDLAGPDRRRHRSRRQDHRRASHLARPRRARTRRRSTRRGGRWAISSGTASASAWRRCHGGGRRHRDHAVAAVRSCRPCRWSPRSRPPTSPPCCSRRRCAGSTSPATAIRRAMPRWPV